ncbi:MAG: TerC family protein [Ardenticatenaceae bacterium]|nr:TerC family protein [Ardenticatenaceae bacterium]MCB8946841.1 TerC family protein [Ardenticatenaceae bacterium]
MADLFTAQNFVAFLTLLALETVLGIDNVIFISILSGKLPEHEQARGRQLGIGFAVISRIILLLAITWVQRLEGTHLLTIFGNHISGKDLVLLLGGLFLIGKSTYEIHEKLDTEDVGSHSVSEGKLTLSGMIAQVLLIDVVFSLDSVITAVGISNSLVVMISAIILAAVIMVIFSGQVSAFIERHPSMKILALSFLILIGSMLVIEGWAHEAAEDLHLKNYIYFAMAFAVIVDFLQLRLKTKENKPVKLHNQPTLTEGGD